MSNDVEHCQRNKPKSKTDDCSTYITILNTITLQNIY